MDQIIKNKNIICKTCNEEKTIDKYRKGCISECKICQNKKDQQKSYLRHKVFYQRHKKELIQINLENYYKRKVLKENKLQVVNCI